MDLRYKWLLRLLFWTMAYPFTVVATNRALNTVIQQRYFEKKGSMMTRLSGFFAMRNFRRDVSDIVNSCERVKLAQSGSRLTRMVAKTRALYAGFLPLLTMLGSAFLADYFYEYDMLDQEDYATNFKNKMIELDSLDDDKKKAALYTDTKKESSMALVFTLATFAHCLQVIMTRMQAVGYANKTSLGSAVGDLLRRNSPLKQVILCGSTAYATATSVVGLCFLLPIFLRTAANHDDGKPTEFETQIDSLAKVSWIGALGAAGVLAHPWFVIARRV